MAHVPFRTCVACRRTRPQRELLRLARHGAVVVADPERRAPGRGAYVCPEQECLEAAGARGARAVRRTLRGGDEDAVVAALTELRRHVHERPHQVGVPARQPTPAVHSSDRPGSHD